MSKTIVPSKQQKIYTLICLIWIFVILSSNVIDFNLRRMISPEVNTEERFSQGHDYVIDVIGDYNWSESLWVDKVANQDSSCYTRYRINFKLKFKQKDD